MATVFDVAVYILKKRGETPAMKLHKLVYYCQSWSLVWEEKALFEEDIEAWANGPVCRRLYASHRLQFSVVATDFVLGDEKNLEQSEAETVDAVLEYYGDKDSQWLSDLTHQEAPWKDARGDLAPGDRGDEVITLAAMAEYYGSL